MYNSYMVHAYHFYYLYVYKYQHPIEPKPI